MSLMFFLGNSPLLTPLLLGAAVIFFLLAARSMWRSRSAYEQRDAETIEWGRPQPSLLQRWRAKIDKILFRLEGLAKRGMPDIAPKTTPSAPSAAPAEPVNKPTHLVLGLFRAPDCKPKEKFVWEETKEVE